MDTTERTCEEAHEQFNATVASLGLNFDAAPASNNDDGENAKLRYFVNLSTAQSDTACKVTIDTEYTCGSAIPLHWYRDLPIMDKRRRLRTRSHMFTNAATAKKACHKVGGLTMEEDEIRRAVRRAYLPDAAVLVGCLFSDASCVEGYTDWLDWAEDFGTENTAEAMRKARRSWDTIQEDTKKLRRMMTGEQFATLLELSAEL